jgi:hypothetical protein
MAKLRLFSILIIWNGTYHKGVAVGWVRRRLNGKHPQGQAQAHQDGSYGNPPGVVYDGRVIRVIRKGRKGAKYQPERMMSGVQTVRPVYVIEDV